MELTISKRDFVRGLARTHGVADRKSSMPILSNVLLTTEGPTSLRFASTDLYISTSSITPAEVKKGGSVALGARVLFDIVKALPEGDVKLVVGDQHAARIACGKVQYRIVGMPGEDFPALPDPGRATFSDVDAAALGDLIAKTSFSMSTDETRPHLSGALFEGEGKLLRMVTTDGHRLSKAERKVESAAMLNFDMLLPHKGVGELRRLLDDLVGGKGESKPIVSVAVSGGNAFFKCDSVLLSAKLVEAKFPPYGQVIPNGFERRVIVGRAGLVEALRRIALVASDRAGGVRLKLAPGKISVSSENPDVGEGSEELEVDYAGGELNIGFNARYLLDALSALGEDDIAIELSG
ncbi:MAG: DNA polymerase III subunit beta, partial [Deltaproteobacteria bacterium]|nr:DNA polymerase III subunit beta [Deltaproteobacteria bacterium]